MKTLFLSGFYQAYKQHEPTGSYQIYKDKWYMLFGCTHVLCALALCQLIFFINLGSLTYELLGTDYYAVLRSIINQNKLVFWGVIIFVSFFFCLYNVMSFDRYICKYKNINELKKFYIIGMLTIFILFVVCLISLFIYSEIINF